MKNLRSGVPPRAMLVPTLAMAVVAAAFGFNRQTCPFSQYGWQCSLLPPDQKTEVNGDIGNDDDGWEESFNAGSSECRDINDAWNAAVGTRVWYTNDMFPQTGEPGGYLGTGNGNGQIILDAEAFGDEFDVDAARAALHEASHDLGCADEGPGRAELWAAYCMQYSGEFPQVPPQEECPGMG